MLVGIVVIILVVGIFGYALFFEENEGSPKLFVDLVSTSGKALEIVNLNLTVSNNGYSANNVVIHLKSEAFEDVSSTSFKMPNGNKSIVIVAQLKDVVNKNYLVEISYTYDSMIGTPESISQQFYVLPNVELFNVRYEEYFLFWDLAEIRQNEDVNLQFRVQSNSRSFVYSDVVAFLKVDEGNEMIIAPSSIVVDALDPNGITSSPMYSFNINANFVPVGQYHLTIVLSIDNHEIATRTVNLTVISE